MFFPRHLRSISSQRGASLMVMLVIMVMGLLTLFVGSLGSSALKYAHQQQVSAALAQAKDAVIGDTVSQPSVSAAGYLRLPDLGFGIGGVPTEGSSAPNFSGNNIDYLVAGKVPWKTLGINPVRDAQGECPWYVVSGRLKNFPTTNSALNWDTLGQIDVIDENGSPIVSNIAALLVAPGQSLDGQSHALSDPTYTQCGGNYDARNYLDSYNIANAVSGQVNYFTGSTNNRVALNANNKQFVMATNDHYNDQFLFITVDDIFRPIIQRSDFSAQITALMTDPYFQTITPTITNKGTGNVNCNGLSTPANQAFCANWLEMLLFTDLPTPNSITIDSSTTPVCTSVLIFGGQKTAAQTRLTATHKSNPANYLEGTNLISFATPTATSSNFNGTSTFKANNPSADVMKCIP